MNYFEFLKKYPRFVTYGLVVKFFSSPGQTFFLSMFSVYFKESLGFQEAFYNLSYSLATLLSAVTISLLGPSLDKVTSLKGTLYVGWGLIIASILMGLTHWLAMWCLCLFLIRFLGQGMMGLTAQTAMIRWFKSNRGKALGLTSIGFSLGEMIFPWCILALLEVIGWRWTWGFVAVLIFVFIILILPGLANKSDDVIDTSESEQDKDSLNNEPSFTRGMMLKDKRFYLFMPALMILPMVATGLIWNQAGIAEWKGWGESNIMKAFMGFGLGRFIFSLVAGPFVDKYSAVKMFAFFLIPVALAVVLPITSSGLWVPWAMYALLGLGQGLAGVIGSALWPELFGIRHIAAIKSFSNTFAVFSTALGPAIIAGILHWNSGFMGVLYFFLGITVLAWILGLSGLMVHKHQVNQPIK